MCIDECMSVCHKPILPLLKTNNNLYKLCVGHFFVKADTCRWVYQSSVLLQKKFLLKCHARIQKRLSGERAIVGPTAVLSLKWRFAGRPIVAQH